MSEQTPIPDLIDGVTIPDELWQAIRRAWDESCGSPSVITKVALAYGVTVGAATAHAEIPGWAHEYGVDFDGDTHWLRCDFCEGPVHPIDAGDSLETIVTKARDHRRTCASGGNRG
ncbi:hypothetical protein ABGB07_36210 [Micromonosporaceae bacterium B7E4]